MQMKTLFALTAATMLAACGQADTGSSATGPAEDSDMTQAGPDAGFEAVAEGNYEVLRADGSIDRLTISPGMLWSMDFADGTAAGGTIFMQGGQTCFVTEGVEGQACFSGTEPAEDGSIESTGETGEVMTVRPVAS